MDTELLVENHEVISPLKPDAIKGLTDNVKRLVGTFSSGEYILPDQAAEAKTQRTRKEMTALRRGTLTNEPNEKKITVLYDRASATEQIVIEAQKQTKAKDAISEYEALVFNTDQSGNYVPQYVKGSIQNTPEGLQQRIIEERHDQTSEVTIAAFDRMQDYVNQIVEKRNPQTHVPEVVKKAANLIRRVTAHPTSVRHRA